MSSNKRQIVLMGILLALLGIYFYQTRINSPFGYTNFQAPKLTPLPGKNSLTNLAIVQDKNGKWIADFDYYYTGDPSYISIQLSVLRAGEVGTSAKDGPQAMTVVTAERGSHHVSKELPYPYPGGKTSKIQASMIGYAPTKTKIALNEVDMEIEWPDLETWQMRSQLASSTSEQNLNLARSLIDSGNEESIKQAKPILEYLIAQDPEFHLAYVEMARVSMKTKWGPEGLHEGENLLTSALRIDPESTEAKILLAYVYSHQKLYGKAEAILIELQKSNATDPWLWATWGELLAMQGKNEKAIAKYREVIQHPMTHDRQDRARADSYRHLIELLEKKKDFDALESLYKQRIAEYGPGSCYSYDYSRFLLYVRGNIQSAIDVSRNALNKNCNDTNSRQILGLAEYVTWATTDDKVRAEHLDQARIYLPESAKTLYLLSKSDKTFVAAKALVKNGEDIDQKDNENLTALAMATQGNEPDVVRRLLSLGAKPEIEAGYPNMPVAFIPVVQGNEELVRLFRKRGTNYGKLTFRGSTALDLARASGHPNMIDILKNKEEVF